MADQSANLKLLQQHLPSLGVDPVDNPPTRAQVIAGVKKYIAMYNEGEAEKDQLKFDEAQGFTEELAAPLLDSITTATGVRDALNKASDLKDAARDLKDSLPFSDADTKEVRTKAGDKYLIGELAKRTETPDPMRANPQLFFDLLEEGPAVIKALRDLQKDEFFTKPEPVAAASLLAEPETVLSPQPTTVVQPPPETTTPQPQNPKVELPTMFEPGDLISDLETEPNPVTSPPIDPETQSPSPTNTNAVNVALVIDGIDPYADLGSSSEITQDELDEAGRNFVALVRAADPANPIQDYVSRKSFVAQFSTPLKAGELSPIDHFIKSKVYQTLVDIQDLQNVPHDVKMQAVSELINSGRMNGAMRKDYINKPEFLFTSVENAKALFLAIDAMQADRQILDKHTDGAASPRDEILAPLAIHSDKVIQANGLKLEMLVSKAVKGGVEKIDGDIMGDKKTPASMGLIMMGLKTKVKAYADTDPSVVFNYAIDGTYTPTMGAEMAEIIKDIVKNKKGNYKELEEALAPLGGASGLDDIVETVDFLIENGALELGPAGPAAVVAVGVSTTAPTTSGSAVDLGVEPGKVKMFLNALYTDGTISTHPEELSKAVDETVAVMIQEAPDDKKGLLKAVAPKGEYTEPLGELLRAGYNDFPQKQKAKLDKALTLAGYPIGAEGFNALTADLDKMNTPEILGKKDYRVEQTAAETALVKRWEAVLIPMAATNPRIPATDGVADGIFDKATITPDKTKDGKQPDPYEIRPTENATQHVIMNMKILLRAKGTYKKGDLDGTYNPVVRDMMRDAYYKLDDEQQNALMKKVNNAVKVPGAAEKDTKGLSIEEIFIAFDIMQRNNMLNDTAGAKVKANDNLAMFLTVLNEIPQNYKDMIFNFIGMLPGPLGKIISTLFSAHMGISLAEVLGQKDPESKDLAIDMKEIKNGLAGLYVELKDKHGTTDPADLINNIVDDAINFIDGDKKYDGIKPHLKKILKTKGVQEMQGIFLKALEAEHLSPKKDGLAFADSLLSTVPGLKGVVYEGKVEVQGQKNKSQESTQDPTDKPANKTGDQIPPVVGQNASYEQGIVGVVKPQTVSHKTPPTQAADMTAHKKAGSEGANNRANDLKELIENGGGDKNRIKNIGDSTPEESNNRFNRDPKEKALYEPAMPAAAELAGKTLEFIQGSDEVRFSKVGRRFSSGGPMVAMSDGQRVPLIRAVTGVNPDAFNPPTRPNEMDGRPKVAFFGLTEQSRHNMDLAAELNVGVEPGDVLASVTWIDAAGNPNRLNTLVNINDIAPNGLESLEKSGPGAFAKFVKETPIDDLFGISIFNMHLAKPVVSEARGKPEPTGEMYYKSMTEEFVDGFKKLASKEERKAVNAEVNGYDNLFSASMDKMVVDGKTVTRLEHAQMSGDAAAKDKEMLNEMGAEKYLTSSSPNQKSWDAASKPEGSSCSKKFNHYSDGNVEVLSGNQIDFKDGAVEHCGAENQSPDFIDKMLSWFKSAPEPQELASAAVPDNPVG